MGLIDILILILVVWLIASLLSWIPAPSFQGRNPVFMILAVILVIVLLRHPLGLRW